MATIQKIFSPRLQRALNSESRLHDYSHIHASYCRIHDEDSLEALLVKSNQSVLLESLEHTSHDLLLQGALMVRGGQAQLYHSWRNRAKKDRKVWPRGAAKMRSKWCPDWAGLADVHGYNNILPGETKLSRNWRSEDLNDYVGEEGNSALRSEENSKALWPIRQLLHYCIESHTRYGYIITDAELVVVRVRPNGEYIPGATIDDVRKAAIANAFIEFQSIPWQGPKSSDELSVNFALYVLFLLASNNGLMDWKYMSLTDEKLPTVKPKWGLCDEYPSFFTDEKYSQEALATLPSTQKVEARKLRPSRKRSRSLSSNEPENKGSHKRSRI
ncbi:hypothetical protein F5X97DRAFT_323340 [Nemania serpens]|nr:hypothetical protein F5X97DRAFT_323340 [Nemania serpens]